MSREMPRHPESVGSESARSAQAAVADGQSNMMRGLVHAVIASGAIWAAIGWAWLLLR